MIQWQDLWVAIALVMVWEGLLPTINPEFFRKMMGSVMKMDDKQLRTMGLSSMIIGAILVYFIRS